MLGTLLLAFLGALVCTIIILVVGYIANKDYYQERICYGLVTFAVEFLWICILLYSFCKAQTPLTIIIWIWPALIVNFIIYFLSGDFEEECRTTIILAVISGIICFSTLFAPVQNMIYVNDMENVDITYAVSSDEILAKVELNIDNAVWRDKYTVATPEMRKVNQKNIAVYHIKNSTTNYENHSEYIPGYAIQEDDELPKIITKRIYFDTSYFHKKDALRTIRRKYPKVIIGDTKFEIDDNYNPYQIYCYREKFFTTSGKDYGFIILNLADGTSEKYLADEVPSWVDFESTYPR